MHFAWVQLWEYKNITHTFDPFNSPSLLLWSINKPLCRTWPKNLPVNSNTSLVRNPCTIQFLVVGLRMWELEAIKLFLLVWCTSLVTSSVSPSVAQQIFKSWKLALKVRIRGHWTVCKWVSDWFSFLWYLTFTEPAYFYSLRILQGIESENWRKLNPSCSEGGFSFLQYLIFIRPRFKLRTIL